MGRCGVEADKPTCCPAHPPPVFARISDGSTRSLSTSSHVRDLSLKNVSISGPLYATGTAAIPLPSVSRKWCRASWAGISVPPALCGRVCLEDWGRNRTWAARRDGFHSQRPLARPSSARALNGGRDPHCRSLVRCRPVRQLRARAVEPYPSV